LESQFFALTVPADTRCRWLWRRNALLGRISTRAFGSLPKSELLGTNQVEKKVAEIHETEKYLMKKNL